MVLFAFKARVGPHIADGKAKREIVCSVQKLIGECACTKHW